MVIISGKISSFCLYHHFPVITAATSRRSCAGDEKENILKQRLIYYRMLIVMKVQGLSSELFKEWDQIN